jgi:hypothetical protein
MKVFLNDIESFGGDFTFVIYKALGKDLQHVQNGQIKTIHNNVLKTIIGEEREA